MEKTYKQFNVTQDIVLFNEKNEALIVKHSSGKWLIPGGRIDEQENWLDSLKREVKEETGFEDFEITGIIEVSSWINQEEPLYAVYFKGRIRGDVTVVPGNEITDFAWVKNVEDLDNYTMWFESLKEIVKKAW